MGCVRVWCARGERCQNGIQRVVWTMTMSEWDVGLLSTCSMVPVGAEMEEDIWYKASNAGDTVRWIASRWWNGKYGCSASATWFPLVMDSCTRVAHGCAWQTPVMVDCCVSILCWWVGHPRQCYLVTRMGLVYYVVVVCCDIWYGRQI